MLVIPQAGAVARSQIQGLCEYTKDPSQTGWFDPLSAQ